MMITRVFLGWDRPFLLEAADWLLGLEGGLAGTLVVVPTAQGGRRLREALAEGAGALLSPRVTTPGGWVREAAEAAAGDWVERLAWVEVLEGVGDWSRYAGLFPEAPVMEAGWAESLGGEFLGLRRQLQEGGLTLAAAGRRLAGTVEGARWEALGRLEDLVERRMGEWGAVSRSRLLAQGMGLPEGTGRIVLAGVADLPLLVERALQECGREVVVLIGAPAGEVEGFSELGRPLAGWAERALPWPEADGGSVVVGADPRQQAVEALRVLHEGGRGSDEVAVGSADEEVGAELARALGRAGWAAFHPGAAVVDHGLVRWMKVWVEWLRRPELAVVAELLELPATGVLVGSRAWKARWLARFRDQWLVGSGDRLRAWVERGEFRSEVEREAAVEVLRMVEGLQSRRAGCCGGRWLGELDGLLAEFEKDQGEDGVLAGEMRRWLDSASGLIARSGRDAVFWIGLMLGEFPAPGAVPPEGRVVDVQGWLELFHEPGRHLVLCGVNEGKVPMRGGGEPWLGESMRERLGLIRDVDRAARDAFLLQAMVRARRNGGRVDLICGKAGGGGETLLPSRLLLAAERAELPGRVKALFRELEPPEAGMRSEVDWRWMPRACRVPETLGLTSLTTYLACPFRYALKHLLRLQAAGTGRLEWDARDFGNVAHEIFERWGRDEEAREFSKVEAVEAWWSRALDEVLAERFGRNPSLAVRIQAEALRQRLGWAAAAQACSRAEGWRVVDVERDFELEFCGIQVRARIDRIDRNERDGRWRVLDYKTGDVDDVEKAHRVVVGGRSRLPAHLPEGCPALVERVDAKGKAVVVRWKNLQLPVYAAAMMKDPLTGGELPLPGYFAVGGKRSKVGLRHWDGFARGDVDAAVECAGWVVSRILEGVFGPPAERVDYDDYQVLAPRGDLAEAFGVGCVPREEGEN